MPGPLMRGIGRVCLNGVEMQRNLYLQTDRKLAKLPVSCTLEVFLRS